MLDQILWFFYLLFLIAAVGPNITYAVWIQLATVDREALSFTLRSIKVINDRLVLPATGLALVAWTAMVYISGQSLLIPWILSVVIFWLVVFLLGLFGYSPTLRNQIALAEKQGADSEQYKTAAWRSTIIGIAIGIVVLMILLLMVFQPNLWG
jgi:hypothetical protein